jgi:hypothetical protein
MGQASRLIPRGHEHAAAVLVRPGQADMLTQVRNKQCGRSKIAVPFSVPLTGVGSGISRLLTDN